MGRHSLRQKSARPDGAPRMVPLHVPRAPSDGRTHVTKFRDGTLYYTDLRGAFRRVSAADVEQVQKLFEAPK